MGRNQRLSQEGRQLWSQRASDIDLILWIKKNHPRDLSRGHCGKAIPTLMGTNGWRLGRSWNQGDQSFQGSIWLKWGSKKENGFQRWLSTSHLHPLGESWVLADQEAFGKYSLCFSRPRDGGGVTAVTCPLKDSPLGAGLSCLGALSALGPAFQSCFYPWLNTPTNSAFPLTGATCRIQVTLPHLIPALMIKWLMKKKKKRLSYNPKHRTLIAPSFRITSSNGNAHPSGDNYSVSRRDLCSHIIGKISSS